VPAGFDLVGRRWELKHPDRTPPGGKWIRRTIALNWIAGSYLLAGVGSFVRLAFLNL
jgi:hypothetical protein